MQDEGIVMSPVLRYWIGDVQVSQGVSVSEMTYIVSGGALNYTHSLTSFLVIQEVTVGQIMHDKYVTVVNNWHGRW